MQGGSYKGSCLGFFGRALLRDPLRVTRWDQYRGLSGAIRRPVLFRSLITIFVPCSAVGSELCDGDQLEESLASIRLYRNLPPAWAGVHGFGQAFGRTLHPLG